MMRIFPDLIKQHTVLSTNYWATMLPSRAIGLNKIHKHWNNANNMGNTPTYLSGHNKPQNHITIIHVEEWTIGQPVGILTHKLVIIEISNGGKK